LTSASRNLSFIFFRGLASAMMIRAAGTARRAAGRIRPSPQLSQLASVSADSDFDRSKNTAHHVPALFSATTSAAAASSFSSMPKRAMSSWAPWRKDTNNDESVSAPSETTFDSTGSVGTGAADLSTSAADSIPTADAVSFGSDIEASTSAEAGSDAVETILREALPWEPDWYWLPDICINWLNYLAETSGMPYAACIAATTLGIRIVVFPLFVSAQRNQSRMAHMKPELDMVKAQIDKMGPTSTPEEQMRYANKMKGLFRKYECNPLKSLAVPIAQAPVFMSMFFGLRKMPDYFPNELANGGLYWFTDLTAADPLHIMPIVSAAMFVGMMEIGKEQMLAGNPQQGPIMLNAFRGLGLMMIPITWNFSSAIFCYWVTNNLASLGQAGLFKNQAMRKMLGIWDPPPPVPGMQDQTIMEQIKSQFEKSPEDKEADKIRLHNEAVGRKKSPPAQRKAGRNRKKRGGK